MGCTTISCVVLDSVDVGNPSLSTVVTRVINVTGVWRPNKEITGASGSGNIDTL